MDKSQIKVFKQDFDAVLYTEASEGIEYWMARDLMPRLGYTRWENFLTAIQRAVIACENIGCSCEDHFRGVRKMVDLGSGAKREIDEQSGHLPKPGAENK